LPFEKPPYTLSDFPNFVVLEGDIFLYSFYRFSGERSMAGVVSYFILLGGAFALAIGLYFGLRTIKLI
jgi:hypothetical protein